MSLMEFNKQIKSMSLSERAELSRKNKQLKTINQNRKSDTKL